MYNSTLAPAIYTVHYSKEEKKYSLIQGHEKFKLPSVLYGNIEKTAIRVWNTFSLSSLSTGILLTGESGSGKSLLAEVICNLALEKGIPVIYITAISVEPELLTILQRISNVVIYMDEFGKCTSSGTQNTMLSFFSDTTTRKLFILTENKLWAVNDFILNRPGRIRYHIDYQKVPKDILLDYLEKNAKDEKFREEVYKLYSESKIFSFDHLQTLVTEHDRYPDDDMNTLLEILNLGVLAKPYVIHIVSIVDNENGNVKLPKERYRYNQSYEFSEWSRYKYNEFIVTILRDPKKTDDYRFEEAGGSIEIYLYHDRFKLSNDKYTYSIQGFTFTIVRTRDPKTYQEIEEE